MARNPVDCHRGLMLLYSAGMIVSKHAFGGSPGTYRFLTTQPILAGLFGVVLVLTGAGIWRSERVKKRKH